MKKNKLISSYSKSITQLKRNGFTLIELLAIIVILAIIAVITVPIILNIIENAKKGAATDSAYGYKDAINKYYISELSKSENRSLSLNGEYDVLTGGILNGRFGVTENTENRVIPIDGEKPLNGKLRYSNNILNGGCLVIGEYKITFKSDGSVDKTEKGNCDDYEFYGFKSINAETGEETEIIPGASGHSVTNRNVYLKYDLIAEGTLPEACVYDPSNSQEMCLKYGVENFKFNTNKIKSFLGYDDSWTIDSHDYLVDPSDTKYCSNGDFVFSCHNTYHYMQTNNQDKEDQYFSNGMVLVAEEDTGIRCYVEKDNALCDWP